MSLLALASVLLLAGGLRAYRIGARSLWIDEIYTYLSATGTQFVGFVALPHDRVLDQPPALTDPARAKPWWATLRPDPDDIHPPLYFVLIRLWAGLWQRWDAAALRAFSAVASVAAVALLYAAVAEWSGRATGLAAALIMAVAQPQVRMAQEARSYALVLALALAAAWAMARLERRGVNRRRVVALALLCLTLPLTHYFALAVNAALAAYALVRLRGPARTAALAATVGAAALFAAAWSPVLYRQAHGFSGRGTAVYVDAAPNHLAATAARLALVPARSLYEPLPRDLRVSMIVASVCLLPLLALRRRPDLLVWLIWVSVNVAPALLSDLLHGGWTLEIERYTIQATAGVYALLAGAGAALMPRRWWRWRFAPPALAAVGCLLHVEQAYFLDDRTTLQKWRELAQRYHQIARPGDLTVFARAVDARRVGNYYLCLGHYAQPLPGPAVVLDGPPSPALRDQIERRGTALLVGDNGSAAACFPGARVTELRVIPFLGEVARLEFIAPAATNRAIAPTTAPPAERSAGSTSRTAPTSRATATPRR